MKTELTKTEFLAAVLAEHYKPTKIVILWWEGKPVRVGAIIKFPYREEPVQVLVSVFGGSGPTSFVKAIIFAVEHQLQGG